MQGSKTQTKPNQNNSPKKATTEKYMPIFGVIGRGLTFAPTTRQQNLFQVWIQQHKRNSTPAKASFAYNMQNETSLPPSIQEPIDDLLDIMTLQNKSPATTSQGMFSPKSNNTDAALQQLFSQRSNTSPSRHTNLERELAFETPEPRSQRSSQPPPIFDVAQVQQEENKKREAQPKKCSSPFPT